MRNGDNTIGTMAVIYLAIHSLILSIFTVLGASSELPVHTLTNPEMDVGNWSVGDCIIAQFAMEFTVSFYCRDLD